MYGLAPVIYPTTYGLVPAYNGGFEKVSAESQLGKLRSICVRRFSSQSHSIQVITTRMYVDCTSGNLHPPCAFCLLATGYMFDELG